MNALGNESSRLERLGFCFDGSACVDSFGEWVWDDLYKALQGIPNLKHLRFKRTDELSCTDSVGITSTLVKLLAKNKLERLSVSFFGGNRKAEHVECEGIFEVLRMNTSLKELTVFDCVNSLQKQMMILDVLERDNTTLEVNPLSEFAEYYDDPQAKQPFVAEQIAYICRLNHLGRGKARNPSTKVEELVDLLCPVVRKHELSYSYSLLRECPSIWCNAAGAGH